VTQRKILNKNSQLVAPSPLGRRVFAIFVDLAVTALLVLLPTKFGPDNSGNPVGILLGLIYFLSRDSFSGGRSVGKRVANLRVLNFTTLAPAGIKESSRRNGLFILCCIFVLVLETFLNLWVARVMPLGIVARIGFVVVTWFCFHYVEKDKRRTKMDVFGNTVVIVVK